MILKTDDIFSNAIKLAISNIFLQVFLRASTFIANIIILRYIDRTLLGIINVRFILLYSTAQLLSREATRRACISDSKLYKWNVSINCIWLNIPILALIGSLLSYIWIYVLVQPDEHLILHYNSSVYYILFSVFIELLSEPFYIFGHLNNYIKIRIFADGSVQILRTFGMLLIVYLYQNENILIKYAYLYFFSSIYYTLFYYIVFIYYLNIDFYKNDENLCFRSFFPNYQNFFTNETKKMMIIIWSFMKQTILKQFLTEGERFVMTIFNLLSFSEQGIYHAINNLGSLAARFIFAPIEESSYLFFSQFIDRNLAIKNQSKKNIKIVGNVLNYLFRLMFLFGLIIIVFGYNYSEMVLKLYAGPQLSSKIGIQLMQFQCIYIAIIAINGAVETYTFAAMNRSELNIYNYLMVFLSFLFLFSCFAFVNLFGLNGFVFALCIQMLARIAYGFYMVDKNFRNLSIDHPLKDILPNKIIIGALAIVFFILHLSSYVLCCSIRNQIIYFLVGCVQFLIISYLIYLKEKDLFLFLFKQIKQKKME